ncbi:hypothetical protein EAI_08496 [Harpegnathos saltator]|uniref:Uncharacterized protein n=1 Tax=Harpegnathos saltator TaxID=610380 RepID=E2BEI6_HARSA|nr:hypothetical protein EAI_08496 [Harpegnathos saltator]
MAIGAKTLIVGETAGSYIIREDRLVEKRAQDAPGCAREDDEYSSPSLKTVPSLERLMDTPGVNVSLTLRADSGFIGADISIDESGHVDGGILPLWEKPSERRPTYHLWENKGDPEDRINRSANDN